MTKPSYKLICLFFILFLGAVIPLTLRAQEERKYSGTVQDSLNPIPFANVFIVNAGAVLLSFAIADERGRFRINLPKTLMQSVWIEATSIGYKKERIKFDPETLKYEFKLVRDAVFLQDVKVTNRPVLLQLGDTLRYIVSSFAKKEDRSIADVLHRMPGIKIMDDGTIYYNDKQIENLYIQGDDLMSGRYGTATKVIRKEMIKSVDVIQNHQPIKVLKDKVLSDKASVNLVLADENSVKVSYGGSVGLGLPGLYDLTANTIFLNKKFKSINIASINNAGVDYRDQLKSQGSGNMAGSIDKDVPELTLSMSSTQPPAIAQRYYYDNRSRILNFNNLYNLVNGFQLKANLQVFNDVNHFSYKGVTQNITVGDTVVYRDVERVRNQANAINGTIQVFANKEKYYFNNASQYKLWEEGNSSRLEFNDNAFSQRLRYRRHEFSNDLHWIPKIKSTAIFELRWLLKSAHYKNGLTLYDGYVSSISGHEGSNDSIIQRVKDPVLFSHMYLSGKKTWRRGTVYQNAGWIAEDHLMQSSLLFVNNGSLVPYSRDAGNYQKWRSYQYYLSTGMDFKINRWSGTLQLPVALQEIYDRQKLYGLNSTHKKIRFNPAWTLLHQFSLEKQASLNYSYTTTFGDFTDTYVGGVLMNYRSLNSSQGALPFNKIHGSSLKYRSQKSIRLFFFNADLSYTHITANTILAADITDSIEVTRLVRENNNRQRWSANAGVSKFLFPIKLNASFKIGCNFSSGNVIVNNQRTAIESNVLSASIQFTKRFSNLISLDYTGKADLVKVASSDETAAKQLSQKVRNLNQTFKTSFIPNKRLLVDFVIRCAIQKNNFITQDYFFSDAKIRYTFSKKKFDVNIEGFNLFNVKNYINFNADSYRLVSNNYYLRGRIVMAKVDIYL